MQVYRPSYLSTPYSGTSRPAATQFVTRIVNGSVQRVPVTTAQARPGYPASSSHLQQPQRWPAAPPPRPVQQYGYGSMGRTTTPGFNPGYEPPQRTIATASGGYPATQWVKITDTTGKSWKFSNASLGQQAIAQLRARGQLGSVSASKPPDPRWAHAANPSRV